MKVGGDRLWNVRKTLGFQSQEQYDRIENAASVRGLTAAKYLSWLADVHIRNERSDREENPLSAPSLLEEDDLERINLRMPSCDKALARKSAQSLGLSVNEYVLRLVREDNSKVRVQPRPDRQAELAAITSAESHIAGSSPLKALAELEKLKVTIVNSQAKNDGLD